jgi:hypothetical protein
LLSSSGLKTTITSGATSSPVSNSASYAFGVAASWPVGNSASSAFGMAASAPLKNSAPSRSAYGSLLPMVGTADVRPTVGLKGKTASQLWAEQMAVYPGKLSFHSAQDTARAKLVNAWWSAIATDDESALFKRDASKSAEIEGRKRIVLAKINSIVVAFLIQAFTSGGVKVPKHLKNQGHVLKASALEDRLKDLRANQIKLEPNKCILREFRAKWEALNSCNT